MIIDVKLFAVARDLAAADVVQVELPAAATVGNLRDAICTQHPALAAVMRQVLIAVDAEYAGDDRAIAPGAEVACIPPVSGG